MGKSQQRKGKRGEEELEAILTEYGYKMKRGSPLNYGTEPDLRGLPGIHIECKRQEHLSIRDAIGQAVRDSKRFGGMPAVFFRSNRQPWKVCMLLTDWMVLYGQSDYAPADDAREEARAAGEDL